MKGSTKVSTKTMPSIRQFDEDIRSASLDRSSSGSLARKVISVLEIVKPVLTASVRNETEDAESGVTVFLPSIVSNRVVYWLQKWGKTIPVPPEQFLGNILQNRGYESKYILSVDSASRR